VSQPTRSDAALTKADITAIRVIVEPPTNSVAGRAIVHSRWTNIWTVAH